MSQDDSWRYEAARRAQEDAVRRAQDDAARRVREQEDAARRLQHAAEHAHAEFLRRQRAEVGKTVDVTTYPVGTDPRDDDRRIRDEYELLQRRTAEGLARR